MSDFETYTEAADAQRIRSEDWTAGEPLRALLSSVTGEPTTLSVGKTSWGGSVEFKPPDEDTSAAVLIPANARHPSFAPAIVAVWNMLNSIAASKKPEDVAAFAQLAEHLPKADPS